MVSVAACVLAGYGVLLALIAPDAGAAVLVIGIVQLGLAALLWWANKIRYYLGTAGTALVAGFFLLGAIENRDATALVICMFAFVPMVLLLLPAARRPYRAAGDDAGPEGWTRELAGGRVKFWLLGPVAVGWLVGGVFMVAAGEWVSGLAIASFGAALLTVLPMFRSWRRHGRPRTATIRLPSDESGAGPKRTVRGTSFPFSPLKSRAAIIGAFFFGVTSLLMLISAPEFADSAGETWIVRIVAFVGAVFFLGGSLFAVFARGAGRGWGVLLLPDCVLVRHGPAHVRLRWDSIAAVEASETTIYTRGGPVHEPFIRLIPDDPSAISGDATDQAIRQLLPSVGADLSFPTRALEADPRVLYHALRYYHANPSDRAELGTKRAIERITSGRASVRAG